MECQEYAVYTVIGEDGGELGNYCQRHAIVAVEEVSAVEREVRERQLAIWRE